VAISDVFEKLGKAIFESPFSASRISEEVPEMAEIRLAALDAIKSKSHRVSGKMVFPFNVVRIHLSGVPEKQAETFQSQFLSKYFEEELRGGLARSSYRFPDDLRVEMQTSPVMPGPKENWIRVETETVAAPPREAIDPAVAKPALVIVQGTANVAELQLEKIRTNIGRTIDVYKSEGPSRRNDLAFEEDTEINRTVSREHAHLMWDKKSGEVRIFNDRWYKMGADSEANCGIWIVRDGLSQPIHRNARGVALKAGDEIHLGRAIVGFVVRG
jgi:pSer/pThr/pTyr-binding forkhead associated (FHA) protein